MGVHLVATRQYLHGFCHAHRGFQQSFAVGVFAQQCQDFFVVVSQLVETITEYFVLWIH